MPPKLVRPRLTLGAGGLAVLLGALDAYVLVSLLTSVVTDLDIPINHLERATPVITGYLLGYVAGMPLLGRLSDRYGRRVVILACLVAFALGSVATASATGIVQLVAGRGLQGLAGGALLPVTMALAADVFGDRRRAAALGWVGAAQELGAVLGPLFGAAVGGWLGWRGIFWLNLPLAALCALAVWFALPARDSALPARDSALPARDSALPNHDDALPARDTALPAPDDATAGDKATGRPKVDVVGGVLLAIALGLLVAGLYNPEPEHQVLPSWGLPTLGAGVLALIGFAVWESRAKVMLIDLTGVRRTPFFGSLLASLCAGAALLVTLVDVQLVAQTVFGKSAWDGTLLLTRFLVALPVGAVLGGLLLRFAGERVLTVLGLLLSAGAYLLIAGWPADALAAHHPLGLPRVDTDLVLAGLSLGLVIAPLSAVVLRVVPAAQRGVASAALVVSRMIGMLFGVAALSAWGFHRFRELTATLNTPLPFGVSEEDFQRQMTAYEQALRAALQTEYREIFLATAVICVVGAIGGLLLGGDSSDRRRLEVTADR
ncbi:MFS family permease [Hamadaea flava]|uniref:MFS-type drug efflux transporter P55 n=1 Tax=Hamadaea flava TaxID=1742688 RepID=A0ABV8LYR8_9ACTN|nr:MFS transporter [Hamadaea flava]MCP2328880.1 MFS family permease [Hamadaea flava]